MTGVQTCALPISSSEIITGTINFHKVSKTGDYGDLLNKAVINTNNTSSLTVNKSETVSGTVNLHKISKTGNYNDLLNRASINSNNSTAQSISSGELISGTINLHKISKTGNYNDLLNKPALDFIPTSEKGASGGVAGLDINKKIFPINLPISTGETLGAIKIGENLDISEDGTVSVSGGIGGSINYDDVQSKPKLNTNNSTAQTVFSAETISGTINLHKISKTGNYNDLLNKPSLDFIPTSEKNVSNGVAGLDKNSKVSSGVLPIASALALGGIKIGNNLNIADDGTVSVDTGIGGSINYNDLKNKPILDTTSISRVNPLKDESIQGTVKLHRVAKIGSYNVLNDTPTLNTNTSESFEPVYAEPIQNGVNLHKISKTGNYNDLSNIPLLNTSFSESLDTLTAEPISGDVNLHKISKTGNYNDLLNKPALDFIPTSEKGASGGVAGLDAKGEVLPSNLPLAATDRVGAAKIGDGLDIDGEGTLSVKTEFTVPIGGIIPFAGVNKIPDNYLLCNGYSFDPKEYPELYSEIGYNYGRKLNPDGTVYPLTPNVSGKTIVGYQSEDSDFGKIGNTGGEKTNKLTIDEIPAHTHNSSIRTKVGSNTDNDTWGDILRGNANVGTVETKTNDYTWNDSTGGGQPHNNLQPYIVFRYIIRAK